MKEVTISNIYPKEVDYTETKGRCHTVRNVHPLQVNPIEFQVFGHVNPRIIRFYDYSFSPRLDRNMIDKIMRNTNFYIPPAVETGPQYFLIWQYLLKPQIYLEKESQKFYASKDTLKQFGLQSCQRQASIILKILKRYKVARFRTASITNNPMKMGKSDKELEETFEALRYVRKKKEQRQRKQESC